MLSRRRFVAAVAAVLASVPGTAWASRKPTPTNRPTKKPKKNPTKKTPAKSTAKPSITPTTTPTATTSAATPTPTTSPTTSPTTATSTPTATVDPTGSIIGINEVRVGGIKLVTTRRNGMPLTVAVSRTSSGFVVVDAACTHAGCIVRVSSNNELLCPCHASRFDPTTGAVLASPAIVPLERYPVEVRGEYLFFS